MPFRQRASSRPVTSRRSPATRQTAERRTVGHSRTITSDLVLFSDLNNYGSIFGGRLVSIIDKTAAISARKHAGGAVMTVAIDSLVFERPAGNGSIITVLASVNRVFRTSMEVGALVTALEPDKSEEKRICRAYLTFVALDTEGHPTQPPLVVPETKADRRRFEHAAIRRQHRLVLRDTLAQHQLRSTPSASANGP